MQVFRGTNVLYTLELWKENVFSKCAKKEVVWEGSHKLLIASFSLLNQL